MTDKVFVDTDLWVYFYSESPKGLQIRELIDRHFEDLVISTQILGEFFHVLSRKKIQTKEKAREILLQLANTFEVQEIGLGEVLRALEIHFQYGYSYWDSQILSSALKAGCSILYSEDLQHNQSIEGLRITNPFIEREE